MSTTAPTRWWLAAAGWLLVLAGGGLAYLVQTAGGVTVTDVRFEFADGKQLSALIHRPPGATSAQPAPAVLAIHGYINSRETQSGFAIELARRGYVVLAIDQTGHGFSDGLALEAGFGGPAALRYLRSLPYVDPQRVVLEGHSMGGWASLAAAADQPDGYRALALVGSSTGPPLAPDATLAWPRNLGVVFSRYDEFSALMWGVERGADVGRSAKLRAAFGSAAPVEPGRIYGDIAAGSARWLAIPAVTHPGDHHSTEAIAATVNWIEQNVPAPRVLHAHDQIWMGKELGTLVALLGSLLVLLGTFDLLLALPVFAGLRTPPAASAANGQNGQRGQGWLALCLVTSVPALTYFPLIALGAWFTPNALFPQGVTNQILVWALGNAALTLVAARLLRGAAGNAVPATRAPGRLSLTVAAVLLSVAAMYLAVAASGWLFATDMRVWVVALKPLAAHHVTALLAYLPLFVVFFMITQKAVLDRFAAPAASRARQYGQVLFATAGGMAVLLVGLYGWLWLAGRLPAVDPLFTIVGIQFVPVLTATALVSVFAWRRTGSVGAGALLSALVVCWYVVAGQATHA